MDRILICEAYNYVARLNHSGQSSLGYAKLSQLARMRFIPSPCGHAWEERGSPERDAAAALLWKRRREIRLHW
jgi:hypothetical protein